MFDVQNIGLNNLTLTTLSILLPGVLTPPSTNFPVVVLYRYGSQTDGVSYNTTGMIFYGANTTSQCTIGAQCPCSPATACSSSWGDPFGGNTKGAVGGWPCVLPAVAANATLLAASGGASFTQWKQVLNTAVPPLFNQVAQVPGSMNIPLAPGQRVAIWYYHPGARGFAPPCAYGAPAFPSRDRPAQMALT